MDIDGELKAELDTEGEEGEEGRWGMRVRVAWEVVAWEMDVDACWVEEDMRVVEEGIGWRRDVEADVRA